MSLLHPSLASAVFPLAHDSVQAGHGRERWCEQAARLDDPGLRTQALALAEDPQGQALIAALCGNSPFLGHTLTREVAFATRFLYEGCDACFAALLDDLRHDHARATDTTRLMAALRQVKRRAALLIAVADMAGVWPVLQVTAALCDVAETALRLACAHLLRKTAEGNFLTLPNPEDPEQGSGLIVLGMGKLGARELNYSSDIDLIVLYDDGLVQTPKPEYLARTFIRLARDLVRIMEERTADGYVFRSDLRLRPDPASTPLAVSVSAAETYYSSVGQNWERAAMIKARPVAGDIAAGEAFLRLLRPYVWRRNLDFAAIQDIHSIKRQINAHKGHRFVTVNGHDIKLGRGGIREIEFFAQTQQLIFGGRDDRLRPRATCAALQALVDSGRVEAQVATDLTHSYAYLRRVEHRVQMVDDQQTHRLPESDEGITALAVFLGYADAESFRAELLGHLRRVEDYYADLFEEAPALAGPGNLVFTGTEDDPATIDTLKGLGYTNPAAVGATVRGWHHGRYRATRSVRARELLTELVPTLLQALARTPNPDAALISLDQFLGNLPSGVQLFSLFHANPKLLDLVAEIMGMAPKLADTLSQNPALLDGVLSPDFFDPLPGPEVLAADFARALRHARDFEDVLVITRRWSHDQRFRAGVQMLRAISDGDRCGPFLADVAAVVLGALADAVAGEFARRHGVFPGAEVAILGMGKLGERQMSVGSDLDLIVVYEIPAGQSQSDGSKPLSPAEYYGKYTQRLISAITAPTKEGRLYEVDMRLRPSGNAGPLAVSLESFCKYQDDQAWTWEHMALTRARPVAGTPALCARLEQAVRGILERPRNPNTLLADVADMRRRIENEFGTRNPWVVKYARGGLIDIEFIAQYLMLRHGATHPQVLCPDMAGALERLAVAGLLGAGIAEELASTLRLWRRVQGFLRLTTDGHFDPATAPPALLAALARVAFPDETPPLGFTAADARIRTSATAAYQHFIALIDRRSPAEKAS